MNFPPCAPARHLLLAAILLAAVVPGSARAGPLGFTGTLAIHLVSGGQPGFGDVLLPGSGVAQVSGGLHLSSFVLPAGVFGPITTSVSHYYGTVNSLLVTGLENRSGSFTAAGGLMGMSGVAKLCLVFDVACVYVSVPLPVGATGTPLVGFGIGGTQLESGAIQLTAQHAAWGLSVPGLTIHTPVTAITTPTIPSGFIHGPASGSASSAAQPSGVVQVVTASKVYTSLTGAFPEFPMWSVLNLHFVPEPGTTALLVAAAMASLLAGRKRK